MVSIKQELKPVYDNARSFYGKANIIQIGSSKYLISYKSLVAYVHEGKAHIRDVHAKTFSQTSLRHIKEFLQQNNFAVGTKKELISFYC